MFKHLIFCYILGGETPEKINGEFLDVKKLRKKSLWIITEKNFHHNEKSPRAEKQRIEKKKKTVPKTMEGTPAKGPLMLPLPFLVYPSTAWREKKVSLREAGKCEVPPRCVFFWQFRKHFRCPIVKLWNITTMMSHFSFILLPLSVCSPLNCSWVCVFFSIPKASKVMASRWTSLN